MILRKCVRCANVLQKNNETNEKDAVCYKCIEKELERIEINKLLNEIIPANLSVNNQSGE
jgi:hypothetical protein